MHDNNSLAHTSWNCKYHIVFAPKYRRKVFYGQYRAEIGKILRELCDWKGVHIIEAEPESDSGIVDYRDPFYNLFKEHLNKL